MQTVSSITVKMRPFFEGVKPEVYERYQEEGFIGQGTFFNGQEFVAFADIGLLVWFYVGDGVIEQFNTRFNNFTSANGEQVAEYCDNMWDTETIKGYVYKAGVGFINESFEPLEDMLNAEVQFEVEGV